MASLTLGVEAAEHFGANVRAARQERGWTQEDLAHRMGLATVQVSRIERGRREVRLKTLLRLLEAFEMSPDELAARGLIEPFEERPCFALVVGEREGSGGSGRSLAAWRESWALAAASPDFGFET